MREPIAQTRRREQQVENIIRLHEKTGIQEKAEQLDQKKKGRID